MYLAILFGTASSMLRDPVQVGFLVLQIAIALAQRRLWPLLIMPAVCAVFISAIAYPRYIAAGLDPWASLPVSFTARFLVVFFVGLIAWMSAAILRRASTRT